MDKKPPAKSDREVVLEQVRKDIANNHWPRLKRPPNQDSRGEPHGTYDPGPGYRVLRLVHSRPKVTDGKEE